MSKRVTSGIVTAIAALALSVPAVGLADKGGTPHKTPAKCTTHSHHGKHKGLGKGKKKGAGKGNKCGLK
jgi:hypothetical protein